MNDIDEAAQKQFYADTGHHWNDSHSFDLRDVWLAGRASVALAGASPATGKQPLQVAEGDMLAARALAKSYRENPREAGLADQAMMRLAAQDPLRKSSQPPAPLPEAQPVSDNGAADTARLDYLESRSSSIRYEGCTANPPGYLRKAIDATMGRAALSASQAHGKSGAVAYPELPEHAGEAADEGGYYFRAYSAVQMRAYVDADRAQRSAPQASEVNDGAASLNSGAAKEDK